MRQDGIGIDARKQRVHVAANFQVRNSALAKDSSQHATPGPVHHVNGKFEVGAGDQIKINKFRNRRDVGLLEVGFQNLGWPRGFGRRSGAQLRLDFVNNSGRRRAAITRLVLHSIPVPGIVTGGNHHSAGCAKILYRVRDRRRRCVVTRQPHRDSRCRNDFRRQARKARRAEAGVVTYYQSLAGVFVL